MKKRIALLLVLVLALTFVLASCDKKCEACVDADIDEVCDVCGAAVPYTPTYLGFEGYYNTDFEETEKIAFASPVKVDGLKNLSYSPSRSSKNLAYFYNSSVTEGFVKAAIYNLDTGAIIKSLDKEADDATATRSLSILTCGEYAYILEEYESHANPYKTTYNYTLYTALGEKIDESFVRSEVVPTPAGKGLMLCNGKLYSVKDDVVTAIMDKDLASVPEYNLNTDKYYYNVITEGSPDYYGESYIYVYDASFKLVKLIVEPNDALMTSMFVLSDGNILMQSVYPVVGDAEGDVEVVEQGMNGSYLAKFDLVTTVYNVETGESKDFDVNYMIYSLENKLTESFVNTFAPDKVDNFAQIVEIVDKKIDYNNTVYASIRTSDLRIIGYLAAEIPEQVGYATLVADNRFIVADESGKSYLINEKAELIGEVTGRYDEEGIEGMLLSADGMKLYDTDLNLLFDANTLRKYDEGRAGGIYVKRWQAYDEEDNPIEKVEYYYLNSSYKLTKLDITNSEYYSIGSVGAALYYTDTVSVENEADKHYAVVFGRDGSEIFRISTDPSSVTEDEVTIVTTHTFLGVETLKDGSLLIRVQTRVDRTHAETVTTVHCYVAK